MPSSAKSPSARVDAPVCCRSQDFSPARKHSVRMPAAHPSATPGDLGQTAQADPFQTLISAHRRAETAGCSAPPWFTRGWRLLWAMGEARKRNDKRSGEHAPYAPRHCYPSEKGGPQPPRLTVVSSFRHCRSGVLVVLSSWRVGTRHCGICLVSRRR